MTERGPLAFFAWLLGLFTLAALFVPACSEDGQTGNCPALTLYNVNDPDASTSQKVTDERARAVDAGCMTPLLDAGVGGSP
jgi:hypothetical protein